MDVALVVPVKSFAAAKGRLAGVLDADARAALARRCAEQVVASGAPWSVYVVCDDDATRSWAESVGASPVQQDSPGLNAAVACGIAAARRDGAAHVVVSHADLPLATTFSHLVHRGEIVLVPDRHRDGTNVLSMPADARFGFCYGPGSLAAHVAAAAATGLPHRIVEDVQLGLDLDTLDDLDELDRRRTTTP
ncbi:MAG: 2-phospho-L-lactate guanylyltransferase [Ilumatobacteraceae bacterium]